jgi:phosphoserine phosphatase
MNNLALINITGKDKPGLTALVTAILSDMDVTILDIGQAVIHDYLNLGILTELSKPTEALLQRIQSDIEQAGLSINIDSVDQDHYSQWVAQQGRRRTILTLLARKIKASHVAAVSKMIVQHNLNIDKITRLSGRIPLQDEQKKTRACVEFSLRGEPSIDFRENLIALAGRLDIDIAVQEDGIFRRHRRLIAFDMDSTLIDTEVIDELALAAGVGQQVAEITERAMSGKLDFQESLRQRVGLLAGLPVQTLSEIAECLPLTEGVEVLFPALKTLGYKTAIISGGFSYFGNFLKARLGVDYVYANELDVIDGKLTGEVVRPVVDAQAKADILSELARKEGIAMEQTIAVGDGANDIEMLAAAGLGIAYHAKAIVRDSSDHAISQLGLDSILFLLGISDREHDNH